MRPPMAAAAGALAVAGVASAAAPLEARALALVNALAEGRFEAVTRDFDATMSGALPAPALAATWQQLQGQVGGFRSAGGTRTEPVGSFTAVLVRMHFERAELDAKIVYGKDGKVSGLFFVPPTEAPAAWTAPAYADLTALSETEVTTGARDWPLPGTLTLPKARTGKLPGVVLVHGSGPHDADESIGPNKPFRDLALGLASRNMAVLRYHKRTHVVAHAARLSSMKGFTLDHETVDDAVAAVEFLAARPEVDRARIYVIGHSLGGTMAPRIAARSNKTAGIVLLAGSTRPLGDMVVEQLTYLAGLDGREADSARAQIAAAEAFRRQAAAPDLAPGATLDLLGARLPGSYLLDLRAYDPAQTAAGLAGPVLVLQGGRDYQVTMKDLDGWKKGLAGKQNATFRVFPSLNHLFMEGTGPSTPAEYSRAGHVDAAVIDAIAAWVSTAARTPPR